ncbi:2-keto-3-deoxygluconate permease [Symbiobacterium terraclitae]|uniref:2-keto-3-deoxygluconate permease n=1 Tax=Symbiobacterium terraclitae TaxID=557451 RepID=UPI0035B557D0
MRIPIYASMQRIPGGIMLVPLILGSLLRTFAPEFLDLGSFTTGLFKNGATPLIALLILATGAQITVRQSTAVLIKSGVVLTAKTIIPGLMIVALGKVFGLDGVLGISLLAWMTAFTNSNGGLWVALASEYGDEADSGAYIASALDDGPFFPLLLLGLSGLGDIPAVAVIAAVIPFVIGIIWGNLDEKFQQVMKPVPDIVIPFFALSLGAGIDLKSLATGGLTGILLGLLVPFITGGLCYLAYRFVLREKTGVGWASGTVAGNAVATPAVVVAADAAFAPYQAVATAQVAAAVLVSAIVASLLTAYFSKRYRQVTAGPAA